MPTCLPPHPAPPLARTHARTRAHARLSAVAVYLQGALQMSLNPPFLCIYFARNRYHMPHAVLFLAGRGRVWSEISPREGCDLSPRRKQALIHFSLENGRLYNRGVKKRLSTAGPGKHESFQPRINPQRASLLSHTAQNLSFRISRVPPGFRSSHGLSGS